MVYDPLGNMLSGTTNAELDPVYSQQAYELSTQLAQEEEERKRQAQIQKEQEALAQQQAQQEAEAKAANPIAEVGAAAVGGLIDFGDDFVEAVGKVGGQDWEFIPDDWGPQNKTQWGKALRSIVSFIGPTIGVGSLTKAGILQLSKLAAIPSASKTVAMLGGMGVDMAAGTAVDVINRNSEGDNLMRVLKDNIPQAVGWLPDDWATMDSDSPDVKRNKNVLEGAGLGLIGSFLEGGIKFARGLKGLPTGIEIIPKDDTAKAAVEKITNKSPQTRSTHPILDRVMKDENYRQQHIDEMALKELDELGGIENVVDYYPNIHSNISESYEVVPKVVRPDGLVQAMVDNFRIQGDIGTVNGRVQPFMTDAAIKALNMDDIMGRKVIKYIEKGIMELGDFDVRLATGQKMGRKELFEAGDKLAAQLLDPKYSAEDLRKLFDDYREPREVLAGQPKLNPINETAYNAAMTAVRELNQFYLNMDTARASAYFQASQAGEVSDLATAARVMGDDVDVQHIGQRILDKMEVLYYEAFQNSSIAGWALNNKKIWQEAAQSKDPQAMKRFAQEALGAFRLANKAKAEQKASFFKSLKDMNKSNPQFVQPLLRAYELTDGNVNSLNKLNDYMANSLGILNKAFIDGNPEIPSQVVQGMWATLYNAKLSSLVTPVKAMSNNFALLLMKPMNIAMGAAFRGDWKTLQRGWVQYATNMDTTMRASADYMGQMFKKVAADPSLTQKKDFITKNNEVLDLAREYAAAEATKGNYAPQMKVQWIDMMSKINDHPWVRYSMNFMESGDAFVKSAIGMAEARGRAFDEFFTKHGRAPKGKEAQQIANDLYRKMFNDDGLLTDEAVKYASSEIAMNLDNEFAEGLNKMMSKAPLLKTLVLFPRTSINVLDFVHKHSPLSYFIGDLHKLRTLKDGDDIAGFLASKGIEYTDQNWKSFRAEVEGRVAMGTALVTMGGWMFASGNLTGNGKYDKQLRKFQQNAGERPVRSWKGIDGKWRSYDGIEPIATFLALTADVLDNMNSLGSTATEHMLQKLGYAVSMNLTNKSFLSGLQPITDLMSGQENAINRWISNTASVGLFNQMSRAMMPGLREVDDDLGSMMRNKWNILDAAGIGENLPYSYDFIDGSIVGREDPITNALNATMPFKTSSNPSPEKQFLIDSEFDIQPALKTSLKGAKYNAAQRSRLAQIMGETGYFRAGLQALMKDPDVAKDLQKMVNLRSLGMTSDQADLSNSRTHIQIRRLLTQSVNHAKRQLAQEIPDIREAELRAHKTKYQQRAGNYQQVINLQNK